MTWAMHRDRTKPYSDQFDLKHEGRMRPRISICCLSGISRCPERWGAFMWGGNSGLDVCAFSRSTSAAGLGVVLGGDLCSFGFSCTGVPVKVRSRLMVLLPVGSSGVFRSCVGVSRRVKALRLL